MKKLATTLALAACLEGEPVVVTFDEEALQVRFYDTRNCLVSELPEPMRLFAVGIESVGLRLNGWYDRETNTIYTIRAVETFQHEMRHYNDPSWRH